MITFIDQEKTFRPEGGEDTLKFVRRIIAEQPNREPLHIVEVLVEIAVGELKGRPCQVEAMVSAQYMKVILRHNGKRIDGRLIMIMGDNTDHVDYWRDGNDAWRLTIRRDIPTNFVNRRHY